MEREDVDMALFGRRRQEELEEDIQQEVQNEADDIEMDEAETDEEQSGHEEEQDIITEAAESAGIELTEDEKRIKRELFISNAIDELIDYYSRVQPDTLRRLEQGEKAYENFESSVRKQIRQTITKDEELAEEVFKQYKAFLFSYSILDPLIADDSISDIKCYGYDHITLKRNGKREISHIKFSKERDYERFVEHVAVKNKVSISDNNALQNFTDTKSSNRARLRFNISTGFVNSSELPIIHIRKIPKTKPTRETLIQRGFFDDEIADYLEQRAATADGILFTGKNASGKTTCMNYLLDHIPFNKSGLAIQENDELFSYVHPDMMFQHTVQNHGEGMISYDLQDLAREGLLSDIDYFIIGEIKGGEALYLLNAVYTGAKGWATVHGASATEAMKKLVDYVKYSSTYSQEEAMEMLVHLNTVVFMDSYKVKQIAEVVGFDSEKGDMVYNLVYDYDKKIRRFK